MRDEKEIVEMEIYCIVDNVAEKVLPVWEAENENVMKRMIATTFKNPTPQDFQVHHIGRRIKNTIIEPEIKNIYEVKEILEEYKEINQDG